MTTKDFDNMIAESLANTKARHEALISELDNLIKLTELNITIKAN